MFKSSVEYKNGTLYQRSVFSVSIGAQRQFGSLMAKLAIGAFTAVACILDMKAGAATDG